GMALAGLIMGYVSTVIFVPIILAIAIPAFLQERITKNQTAAASSMRTINAAQVVYVTDYPNAGYARNLATLGTGSAGSCAGGHGTADHACLLDKILGCDTAWCKKDGYNFMVSGAECEQNGVCGGYVVVATPLSTTTGKQSFCSTPDAVIRVQRSGQTLPITVEQCSSWPPIS